MGNKLDRFCLCELCKKPISDSELCYECNMRKKRAQEFAIKEEATLEEVSEKFEIPDKVINRWIKKGEFWCFAPCRSCGKMIKGGNICAECRIRFASELKR